MVITKSEPTSSGWRRFPSSQGGRLAASVIAAAAVGGIGLGVYSAVHNDGGSLGPKVVAGQAAEQYPTLTASDWVTHGDYAAVLEVVPGSEQKGDVQAEDKDHGEGYIPRTATVKVDEVLWSNPQASAAPSTYKAELMGWWWKGDSTREFAWKGEPRIEAGHKYIGLLVKQDDGTWATTLHVMPYDNGKVGTGEVAGLNATDESTANSLEEQAAGKDANAVRELLAAAEPAK